MPELFQTLRGVIDKGRRKKKGNGRFLILGSASMGGGAREDAAGWFVEPCEHPGCYRDSGGGSGERAERQGCCVALAGGCH